MQLYSDGSIYLLYIFSGVFLALCVTCIVKRRFLEFFFSAILFLPDYYGFDISGALPIISVKRIMFVVLFIYAFVLYGKQLIPRIKSFRFTPVNVFAILYFLFRIVSNLFFIGVYSQAIKTIFVIIFEQALLLLALQLISPGKEECISVVKSVVYTSVIIFVLGLTETFTGFRFENSLYTIGRYMLNEHYVRAGLLRSTSTLGLPTFLGNYCVIILPLIIYLFEHTRQKRYFVFSGLAVLTCIHTGTRSSFLFLFAVVIMGVLLHCKDRKRLIEYCKNTLIITGSLLLLILILSLAQQRYRYYYISFGKSVLNTVGFDFNLAADEAEDNVGYGSNKNGVVSRTKQLTGIIYVADVSPIFGLGSGAQSRGDLRYYYQGAWRVSRTYDVGYVEVFCDEGILGSLGYISLFVSLFIALLSKKRYIADKNLANYLLITAVTYLICLLSSANMSYILFSMVSLIYITSKREEPKIS